MRQILSLDRAKTEWDFITPIAEEMSWNKLIHTAYFDVYESAKLITYVLHKAGLAPLSESFKTDRDFERIKLAYESLPPLTREAS
jgi:hypothetical protein